MSCTRFDDLVDEWSGIIFFGARFVQIPKIGTHAYGALFFHDGNRVGNPRCIGNGVDKPEFVKLIDL